MAAVLALTACAGAPAAPTGPLPVTTVPVQVVGGAVFVSVSVNRSDQATLFLVDTGASLTILAPLLAKRLGLAVPAGGRQQRLTVVGGSTLSVPLVTLERLAVAEAVVHQMVVGVHEILPEARAIDGLLGADFLNRFRMTLDRVRQRMILEPLGH